MKEVSHTQREAGLSEAVMDKVTALLVAARMRSLAGLCAHCSTVFSAFYCPSKSAATESLNSIKCSYDMRIA